VLFKFIFLRKKNKYDIIFVGFLSQTLLPFIRFFYKKRIIADFFISVFDTICNDRKVVRPDSFLGQMIFLYENWILHLTDGILTDTEHSKIYLNTLFNYPKGKIKVVYALANSDLFYPMENKKKKKNQFNVFYYGSCQPLHGIDTIIKSAKLLEKENINFLLIGPIRKKYDELIRHLKPNNVEFIDYVDYEELPIYISGADLCLGGHFSGNEKAGRVIAGKTFQFASMKKAVIIGDYKANHEIFHHGRDAYFVGVDNAPALAEAILELRKNDELRKGISSNAFRTISEIEKRMLS